MKRLFTDPVGFALSLIVVYVVYLIVESSNRTAASAYVAIILLSAYAANRDAMTSELQKMGLL